MTGKFDEKKCLCYRDEGGDQKRNRQVPEELRVDRFASRYNEIMKTGMHPSHATLEMMAPIQGRLITRARVRSRRSAATGRDFTKA